MPPLGYLLVRLLFLLCKKEILIHKEVFELVDKPFIAAFWHGEMLFQPILYQHIRQKPKGYVISSLHFDGEVVVRLIKFFNLETIRGSTSRGSVRVFLKALRALREGKDIAITPDGPTGPYHKISNGIVALSQKSNVPIVIFRFFAQHSWQMKSWDRFLIPKPFSSFSLITSKPIYIQELSEEEATIFIKQEMEYPFETYYKSYQESYHQT